MIARQEPCKHPGEIAKKKAHFDPPQVIFGAVGRAESSCGLRKGQPHYQLGNEAACGVVIREWFPLHSCPRH